MAISSQAESNQKDPFATTEKEEKELFSLLNIFWKHKGLMALMITLPILITTIYCFLKPKEYQISMIVSPGITSFGKDLKAEYGFKKDELRNYFSQKIFMGGSETPADQKKQMPANIQVSSFRKSKAVTVSFKTKNSDQGLELAKLILNLVTKHGGPSQVKDRISLSKVKLRAKAEKLQNKIANLHLATQKFKNKILVETERVQRAEEEAVSLANKIAGKYPDKIKQIEAQIYSKDTLINKYTSMQTKPPNAKNIQNFIELTALVQNAALTDLIQERRVEDLQKQLEAQIISKKELDEFILAKKDYIQGLNLKVEQELPIQEQALLSQLREIEAKTSLLSPLKVERPPYISSENGVRQTIKLLGEAFILGICLSLFSIVIVEFFRRKPSLTGKN